MMIEQAKRGKAANAGSGSRFLSARTSPSLLAILPRPLHAARSGLCQGRRTAPGGQRMSTAPENEFDLEKLFLPAWAQEPSSAKQYAQYEGREERSFDRGPSRGGRPENRRT